MLEQILDSIHNYFVSKETYGRFEITSGVLAYEGLLEGQYFKLEGSSLNDGIYQWPTNALLDESFDGCIKELSIPRKLVLLADEIQDWMDKYGDVVNSPYQSESFGNYSYSKSGSSRSGRNGNNSGTASWQDVFRTRLNAYRKIS